MVFLQTLGWFRMLEELVFLQFFRWSSRFSDCTNSMNCPWVMELTQGHKYLVLEMQRGQGDGSVHKLFLSNKFIQFIQFMQKGNLYIACEWGTYTTDGGLMLNYFFNPLFKGTSEYLSPDNKIHLYEVRKLYNNLTSEHKKMLGWTKEFDTATAKKLEKLLIKP